jgi:tRNA-specific adenosine deaminase 1
MELTMASQLDATPWPLPTEDTPDPQHMRGRGFFSLLGIVRLKPGRRDSPPTSAKSCSDKLSARQALSLLLTPTSYLLSPRNAYITTLTLPTSSYSAIACTRAFSTRLQSLAGREWGSGYSWHPFSVQTTAVKFAHSRRDGKRSSNLSAVVVANRGQEVLIGGVQQGRKQFSGEAAGSMLCKLKLWREVAALVPEVRVESYARVKTAAETRNCVKEEVRTALGGWIRTGGDEFALR